MRLKSVRSPDRHRLRPPRKCPLTRDYVSRPELAVEPATRQRREKDADGAFAVTGSRENATSYRSPEDPSYSVSRGEPFAAVEGGRADG